MGGRLPLGTYLRRLWQRRQFTLELARSRWQAETTQDRLGIAWVVIKPLLNAAVYGLVFGFLLFDRRPANFVPFLVTGVFVFSFFSTCLVQGAKSITSNGGLVRALRFPRAVLPIARVLQEAFNLAPMMAVLAIVVLAFGEPLRPHWLLAVPALLLLAAFSLGVAFITARLTVHVRDLSQLLPFVSRVLFYISGIFFSIERITDNATLQTVLQSNPAHIYIALVRSALMASEPAPAWMWPAGAGWALAALVGGFLFFWRAEDRYGRD